MLRRAALACVLLTAAALSACGGGEGTSSSPAPVVQGPPAPAGPGTARVPAAAAAVAERYAIAARVLAADAARAREGYRTQLQLTTGEMRAALKRFPIGEGDVEQLRLDGAAATGRVSALRPIAVSGERVELAVAVLERTSLRGEVAEATVRCRMTLIRDAGAWRVSAFTVLPNDPTGVPA